MGSPFSLQFCQVTLFDPFSEQSGDGASFTVGGAAETGRVGLLPVHIAGRVATTQPRPHAAAAPLQ